jgi:predicted nucleotidyltransferase
VGEEKVREIEESVRRFKRGAAKKFFVERLIVFGSAARGELGEHSDIDLIVVSRKYGRKDVFKIVPELYREWHQNQRINYPVDIILFSTEEFERLKREVSIVSEALREGIEV